MNGNKIGITLVVIFLCVGMFILGAIIGSNSVKEKVIAGEYSVVTNQTYDIEFKYKFKKN